jgi:hypothetical protein
MQIWFLDRPVTGACYDAVLSFIVRAESEGRARQLAAENCGWEGPNMWLKTATCVPLTDQGKEEIIVREFNAG